MDTPGGLDTSMREIIRDILASPVPIITYVSPERARAASAGTYILYASHVAAMAPGTNLGAATPVQVGGGGLPFGGSDKDEDKDGEREDKPRQPRNASRSQGRSRTPSPTSFAGRTARPQCRVGREGGARSGQPVVVGGAGAKCHRLVADDLEDVLAQADGLRVSAGGEEIVLETRGIAIEHVEPDWRTGCSAPSPIPTWR
jgi:membrane-bound serine protease (ClpP class)